MDVVGVTGWVAAAVNPSVGRWQFPNLDSPAQLQTEIAFHVNSDPIQHELHFERIRLADDLKFETADERSCICDGLDQP
jgi:hypothetical protein